MLEKLITQIEKALEEMVLKIEKETGLKRNKLCLLVPKDFIEEKEINEIEIREIDFIKFPNIYVLSKKEVEKMEFN